DELLHLPGQDAQAGPMLLACLPAAAKHAYHFAPGETVGGIADRSVATGSAGHTLGPAVGRVDEVVAGPAAVRVDALAPVQPVVAGAANQDVAAHATAQEVPARATGERVHTVPPRKIVRAVA